MYPEGLLKLSTKLLKQKEVKFHNSAYSPIIFATLTKINVCEIKEFSGLLKSLRIM